MTEAGWTRNKPTVAGWYWNRISGAVGIALIMRRDCQLYAWLRFKDAWLSREGWLDYIHGEWLGPITPDSYQQGRVAGLDEVERYMAMRLRMAEASLATEILAGNEVKQGRERAAIAELHGMQRHVSDIKEYNAQQAQEGGVGDDLFILP